MGLLYASCFPRKQNLAPTPLTSQWVDRLGAPRCGNNGKEISNCPLPTEKRLPSPHRETTDMLGNCPLLCPPSVPFVSRALRSICGELSRAPSDLALLSLVCTPPLVITTSCRDLLPLGLLLPSVYPESPVRSGDCRPRGQGRENALESGPDWKADKMQGGEEGKWTLETRGHPCPSSAPLAEPQQGAQWPAVHGRLLGL